jgi:AcrR family transcriptional regulator
VFRARGFANAGMRDIATAADLSPGNLYHYFRGKNELLFFCQDRSADRLLAALTVARRDRRPLPDRLRDMAIAHVLCLIDEVEGSAAHLEINTLPPRLRARIVAKRDQSAPWSQAACAPACCTSPTPPSPPAHSSAPSTGPRTGSVRTDRIHPRRSPGKSPTMPCAV